MIDQLFSAFPFQWRQREGGGRQWRWLIILLVFLASAALALRDPRTHLTYVLLFIAGSTGVYTFLRWPSVGLVLLVAAGLIVPIGISTGTGTDVNATVVLLCVLFGLWIFELVVSKGQLKIILTRAMIPLLGLVLAVTLSFGIGQFPWFVYAQHAPLTAQIAGLSIFIFSALAFILVANQLKDVRWLEWMTWTLLMVGVLFLGGSLLPRSIGSHILYLFSGGSVGSLFFVWIAAMSLSQGLLNQKMSRFWRGVLLVLALANIAIPYLINQDWKSGWIPAVAVSGVIMWLWAPKLGALGTLVALVVFRDLPAKLISTDQYSYDTRTAAWQLILTEIVKVNPVLGLGPANYHFYTPLFSILGYYIEFNSHNNYVDVVAQAGLLGLAFFLWFFGEIGWLGWKLRRVVPRGGFEYAFVIGCLGGLGGTIVAGMLGDWVIPFIYNIGLRGMRASILSFVFFAGLVVLEKKYLNQPQGDQE